MISEYQFPVSYHRHVDFHLHDRASTCLNRLSRILITHRSTYLAAKSLDARITPSTKSTSRVFTVRISSWLTFSLELVSFVYYYIRSVIVGICAKEEETVAEGKKKMVKREQRKTPKTMLGTKKLLRRLREIEYSFKFKS